MKRLETLQDTSMPDPTREMRYILDLTRPYDNLLMTEGSQNQSFVWGNTLISAEGEDNFYYLQDHLGSPIRLMGDGLDEALAFDEFGVALVQAGQTQRFNQPFGFTGYQTDNISGLYYAQARYFEPNLGRFTAQDTHWNPGNMIFGDLPLGMPCGGLLPNNEAIWQSKNLYLYCLDAPLFYADKTGGFANAAVGGITGGIYGGIEAYRNGDPIGRGIGAGAAEGAIAGAGVDAGLLAVAGAKGTGGLSLAGLAGVPILGGIGNYAGQRIKGASHEEIDIAEILIAAGFNVVDFGIAALSGGVSVAGKTIATDSARKYLKEILKGLIPDSSMLVEQILSFAYSTLPQWVIDILRGNETFAIPECESN